MKKDQHPRIGDEVYIVRPGHAKHGEMGIYAGLGDVPEGLEERHRVSFDGEIHLAYRHELNFS